MRPAPAARMLFPNCALEAITAGLRKSPRTVREKIDRLLVKEGVRGFRPSSSLKIPKQIAERNA